MGRTMTSIVQDPQDAQRYTALAVLLGRLSTEEEERLRFATLFRREAREDEAMVAMAGLLDAAATLRARESAAPMERMIAAA